MAIIEAVPEHRTPDRRLYVSLYATGLMTRTASGRVHAFGDDDRRLRDTGARDIARHDCHEFPATAIAVQVPRSDR